MAPSPVPLKWWHRIGWFLAYWLLSVAALAVVAYGLRAVLMPVAG